MSLILVFHNTQKEPGSLRDIANYDVWVGVGDGSAERTTKLYEGKVEHHLRSDGWKVLVQKFLDSL